MTFVLFWYQMICSQFFPFCFSLCYQKLNVIRFVLVLNDLFQIFSICFSPGDQKPNVICFVLVLNDLVPFVLLWMIQN